jgi:hypothetical protein
MGGSTTIPRSISGFDLYLIRTCAYLILGTPTNAVRFNWTAANLTAWQNFLTQWTPLFNQYSDKKAGYTTNVKNKLLTIIANAVIYAENNKLIELVKACLTLNTDDCSAFNLPAKLAIPSTSTSTHPLAKAKEADKTIIPSELVYPRLIPIGGSIIHIKAFAESSQSGRPHKLEGFDLLEYLVGIFYLGTSGLPTKPTDTRLTTAYSSKSNFKLPTAIYTSNLPLQAAGATEPAKIALFFFRWAKSKHPDLDGPWSGPFTTLIL